MTAHPTSALPAPEDVQRAAQVTVLDEHGKEHRLGELWEGQDEGRTVVVWIRHFGCGLCQDYVKHLSQHFAPPLLSAHNVRLSIIGCGDSSYLSSYRKLVACPFDLYADRDGASYDALGMGKNLGSGETRPEYQKSGMAGVALKSISSFFQMGNVAFPGEWSRLGGECVFEQGQLKWCHRMQNTRDHAPLKELAAAAGVPLDSAAA
ncbi:peroxiredoxin-like family protein [Rhodotorula paludigena]|uniref:peroxiredoxin-like family protein n=1 Tax=Rhodotorula paludigena TaxID=86838 RepID=UPI00317B68C8